jgi:hypothetical protein
MEDQEWYEIATKDESISQGEFIKNCPILIPPKEIPIEQIRNEELSELTTESLKLLDVIILSQSCDLVNKNKIETVIVCPVWTLSEFESINSNYKDYKMKEALRKGAIPSFHLLNRCNLGDFNNDYIIVDFKRIYNVNIEYLKSLPFSSSQRIRLKSPYLEHLSQSFARFFMRVGLPSTISEFKEDKQKEVEKYKIDIEYLPDAKLYQASCTSFNLKSKDKNIEIALRQLKINLSEKIKQFKQEEKTLPEFEI